MLHQIKLLLDQTFELIKEIQKKNLTHITIIGDYKLNNAIRNTKNVIKKFNINSKIINIEFCAISSTNFLYDPEKSSLIKQIINSKGSQNIFNYGILLVDDWNQKRYY